VTGPQAIPPYDVACPECAQQPGEWCANWVDLRGMVEDTEYVHGGRIIASAEFRGDTLPIAPEPMVHRVIAKTVLDKLFGGV